MNAILKKKKSFAPNPIATLLIIESYNLNTQREWEEEGGSQNTYIQFKYYLLVDLYGDLTHLQLQIQTIADVWIYNFKSKLLQMFAKHSTRKYAACKNTQTNTHSGT